MLKSVKTLGIGGEGRRQNFQGDYAIEARVTGSINFAHPTRSDNRLNFVWPKLGARG